MALGITYFFAFNCVVFHRQQGWTVVVVVLGGLVCFVGCAGLNYFGWSGGSLAEVVPQTSPWGVSGAAVALLWLTFRPPAWYLGWVLAGGESAS